MAKAEKITQKLNQEREDEDVDYGDMVFGHLEDKDEISSPSLNTDESMEEEEGEEGEIEVEEEEESNDFWRRQREGLEATMCRSGSLETRIRQVVKVGLKEISGLSETSVCGCGRPMAGGCKGCLMREVTRLLVRDGLDCAVCRSKWRSSPDIPSGEHRFIDVVDRSSSGEGEIRVIIELNFRSEFEMARASKDYTNLVRSLPETFVGKPKRLNNVIKIMSAAAKRCMEEKKMHLGPWRKHKYMYAKWLGTCVRENPIVPTCEIGGRMFPIVAAVVGNFGGGTPVKPRASMLSAAVR